MVVRAEGDADGTTDVDNLSASLLRMVTRSLPLRTAVIFLSDGAGLRETVWRAPGTRPRCLAAARAHARAFTRYFTQRPATWKVRGHNRPRRHFVSLPITTGGGLLVGLVQVEGASPPTERDLMMMCGIVNIVAAATVREPAPGRRRRARAPRQHPMLAVLAHDFGNHLAVVQMNTETLLSSAVHDHGSRRELLVLTQMAVSDMRQMTEDLLNLAKIEAGALTVRKQEHRAAGLIEDAIRRLEPMASARLIHLKGQVPFGDLSTLRCDALRVQQVFSNLIGNALKYTPAHGSVVVRLDPHEDELRFLISDTGEGIAARDLPRVFERFWQAQPRRGEGSGLGLSAAKEIVEAMGGRIWAQSSLGAGSTFGFSLPIG